VEPVSRSCTGGAWTRTRRLSVNATPALAAAGVFDGFEAF
jgi:hypothetical protein